MATTFYVNDNQTNGDIYTTTIGNDSNNGKSAASPKLTITAAYQIAEIGDTIIIDIGSYKDISATGEILFKNLKKIQFIIAGISNEKVEKTPLPNSEKVSPSIFYIENDKPVSREVYMQRFENAERKK